MRTLMPVRSRQPETGVDPRHTGEMRPEWGRHRGERSRNLIRTTGRFRSSEWPGLRVSIQSNRCRIDPTESDTGKARFHVVRGHIVACNFLVVQRGDPRDQPDAVC